MPVLGDDGPGLETTASPEYRDGPRFSLARRNPAIGCHAAGFRHQQGELSWLDSPTPTLNSQYSTPTAPSCVLDKGGTVRMQDVVDALHSVADVRRRDADAEITAGLHRLFNKLVDETRVGHPPLKAAREARRAPVSAERTQARPIPVRQSLSAERSTDSYNEWVVRDFLVRGILACPSSTIRPKCRNICAWGSRSRTSAAQVCGTLPRGRTHRYTEAALIEVAHSSLYPIALEARPPWSPTGL
jgi:hypothetical protein